MKDIAVVGAGKIGAVVGDMLDRCGDYRVALIDSSRERLEGAGCRASVERLQVDAGDSRALGAALAGRFAVICATPYTLTPAVAQAAADARTHYLDLTEGVASTRFVRALAEDASTAFIPQCGLAPGFISIVAADMIRRFERLDEVRMRVGALPQHPLNALKYNLTWSTEGLINQYCEPCEAIVDGVRRETQALEEREEFALDGVPFEAFNTSGGLGSMCETLEGKVRMLNYRTIRYPGHSAIMKVLLNDLGLRQRRDVLRDLLEASVPATEQDVVIVLVTVSGWRGGRLMRDTYVSRTYASDLDGQFRSAIQITTCSGVCGVLDLLAEGRLPQAGLVRQEEIGLADFLANRFGRNYGAGPVAGGIHAG